MSNYVERFAHRTLEHCLYLTVLLPVRVNLGAN